LSKSCSNNFHLFISKSLRQFEPFGFREVSDVQNSTNYKTGWFREGSETRFPRPKPDFWTFTSILRVFGPRMFWESGFGAFPKLASFVLFSKLEKISVLEGLTIHLQLEHRFLTGGPWTPKGSRGSEKIRKVKYWTHLHDRSY